MADFPEKSVTVARTLNVPSKVPVKLILSTNVVLNVYWGFCCVIETDLTTCPA